MVIRITWWGHATFLVEDGARLLTDPLLTDRLVHLRRRAGLSPDVPDVDAVLVSHAHADHLHPASLARLRPGTAVLVPRGAASLLRRLPLEPVEVEAGDVVACGGAAITVVPAVHADTRWPWSRLQARAVGYLVRGSGATYFAGDTARSRAMADLGPHVDVALLPVGGWGPWLRGGHLTPETAAACLPLISPRVAVPMHYGTFWPRGLAGVRRQAFSEPGHQFARHAGRIAPEVDVRVLPPGASTEIRLVGDGPA